MIPGLNRHGLPFGSAGVRRNGQVLLLEEALARSRALLPFHHYFSQDSCMVALAFGLEPVHHLGVHLQGDLEFARTVPTRLGPAFSSARNCWSSSTDLCSQAILPLFLWRMFL